MRGNKLLDSNGRVVQLRGVNRSGLEYACIQGWGLFDGPSDAASVAAMAAWGVNAVRLPLNEDCWLGINTPDARFSGGAYRSAVTGFVQLLHEHGMVVILDLQWAQAGQEPATSTAKLADKFHAPAFWTSVAKTFAADRSVMFDLYNEPHDVTWSCWRDGCVLPEGWLVAGMQSLVDAVRGAGARQPVLVGGLDYANDLSGWLEHAPTDPAGQLIASLHMYNFNVCNRPACWQSSVAAVAAQVPVVTGELGEDDRRSEFIQEYMDWADGYDISYLGWSWNTWKEPTALIADYRGRPTPYGSGLRRHLLRRAPAARATAAARVDTPISRGQPVYASPSIYPPQRANDEDYSQVWRSSGYPCWLAYDLSGLPPTRRRRVYSSWSNINTFDYDSSVFAQLTYNIPADYVIETNAAPGGTKPPPQGWTTLISVRGNTYHSAAHLLDLGQSPWVRLRASAGSPSNAVENRDCALQWDLYDASAAVPPSWIFYGDSITAAAMAPYPGLSDSRGRPVPAFAELVNSASPHDFPAQQAGGVGGLSLEQAMSQRLVAKWLADYPGTYVGLSLGLNDANNDGFDANAFYSRLVAAVKLITEAGKVPVVPTLIASQTPNVRAHGPDANRKIRQIYREYPAVLPGPDLWSVFSDHPEWISSQDPLHPTDVGYGQVRAEWARVALSIHAGR